MAISTHTEPVSTSTMTVTIRIPHRTDSDLATAAEDRLSRSEYVADASIDELHGLNPQLSATVITVGVTIRWARRPPDDVETRLTDVPGVESIDTER
jgi:hypothetical protein